jgi:hypothetical protein
VQSPSLTQERLLHVLSMVLAGRPFVHAGAGISCYCFILCIAVHMDIICLFVARSLDDDRCGERDVERFAVASQSGRWHYCRVSSHLSLSLSRLNRTESTQQYLTTCLVVRAHVKD